MFNNFFEATGKNIWAVVLFFLRRIVLLRFDRSSGMALNFTRTCAANELRRNSKLRQTKCSPNVSPFVGKQNAFMMGRQSLDLTKQQKNNIWSCIQIPRFSRVLTILIWIKVQNVLDASNFPKTQPQTHSRSLNIHFLQWKSSTF